jgi:hypothetical protein
MDPIGEGQGSDPAQEGRRHLDRARSRPGQAQESRLPREQERGGK